MMLDQNERAAFQDADPAFVDYPQKVDGILDDVESGGCFGLQGDQNICVALASGKHCRIRRSGGAAA